MTFVIVSTGTYTGLQAVVKRGTLAECEKHMERLNLPACSSSWLKREIMPLVKVPKDAVGR